MANTVDTRIVEAKFDSSDFEKGVNKTIKKLDELKKSLELKDTGKSVTDLTKNIEESTEKSTSALEKLSKSFTTFTGLIKQQLLSGLASEVSNVFLNLERSIKGFASSLGSQQVAVGMNKYNEMLTAVRTMVTAGHSQDAAYNAMDRLAKYSDQTSYSLSQMSSMMSKLVAAGAGLDKAEKMTEGLANAAASAGVNIYDANRAFYNFAQAYSKGTMQNIDWRSFELLNMTTKEFQQAAIDAALTVGTLVPDKVKKGADGIERTIYKTSNKIDKKVKASQQVIAGQGLSDTLKYNWFNKDVMQKLLAEGYFWDDLAISTEEAGDMIKTLGLKSYLAAKEARSFTDVMGTLKDVIATGWSQTFENLFGKLDQATKFFTWLTESKFANTLYSIGEWRNEVLGEWNRIGMEGFHGSEMFEGSLKNIDELLGIVKEAFSNLVPDAKKLGGELWYATFRIYRATTQAKDALREWLNTATEKDGPTRVEKLSKVLSVLGTVVGIVSKAISTGFTIISKVFQAVAPVFDSLLNVFSQWADNFSNFSADTSLFDDISNALSNLLIIADPILKAIPPVLEVLGQVAWFFIDSAIQGVVMNIQLFSDALGFLIELFGGTSAQKAENGVGFLDSMSESIQWLKDKASGTMTTIKEFFTTLFEDLRILFGLKEPAEGDEGGAFSGLKEFFNTNEFVASTKEWINKALEDIKAFIISLPDRITKLGDEIAEAFDSLFYTKQTRQILDGNGKPIGRTETVKIKTALGQWVDDMKKSIEEFIPTIPSRLLGAFEKLGAMITSLFYTEETRQILDGNGKPIGRTEKVKVKTALGEWVDSFKKSIEEFIPTIPGRIKNAISEIGRVLTSMLYTEQYEDSVDEQGRSTNEKQKVRVYTKFGLWVKSIVEGLVEYIPTIPGKLKGLFSQLGSLIEGIFFDTEQYKVLDKTTGAPTGEVKTRKKLKKTFSTFIKSVLEEITNFIKSIPDRIQQGIKGVGSILSSIIGALFGKKDGSEVTSNEIAEGLEKPFEGLSLSGVFGKIKEIGATLLNTVIGVFSGSDDVNENQEWFASKVASGIEWIREKAENAFKTVSDWFVALPGKIADFFSGERTAEEVADATKEAGPVEQAVSNFGKTIGEFIASIPGTLLEFFNNAIDGVSSLWDRLYTALRGENPDETGTKEVNNKESLMQKAIDEAAPTGEPDVSKWEEFVSSLGNAISNLFQKLPSFIVTGIDAAVILINKAIQGLSNMLAGDTEDEASKAIENSVGSAASDAVGKMAKETDKNADQITPLRQALQNLGGSIENLITETIPTFLSNGWKAVSENAGNWWNSLTGIFDSYNTSDLKAKVDGIGETIKGFILNIPSYINSAFEALQRLFVVDSEEQYINTLSPRTKEIQQGVKEHFDELAGVATEREASPMVKAVQSIGQAIKQAFIDLGPMILDGLTIGLGAIEKGFNWFTELFSTKAEGESLTEAISKKVAGDDEKGSELAQAIARFVEKIKNIFTKTIPEFFKAAVPEVASAVSDFFSDIFGQLFNGDNVEELVKPAAEGMKQLGEAAGTVAGETKSEDVKKTDDVLTVLSNMLSNFTSGSWANVAGQGLKFAAIAAAVIAIAHAIGRLADVVDVSGNLTDMTKWSAIRLALVAIIGLFGYIVWLSQQPQDVVDRAGEIIDKLTGFFTTIAAIVGSVVTITKVASAVKAIKTFTKEATAAGGEMATFWGMFKGSFASSFGSGLGGVPAFLLKGLGALGLADLGGNILSEFIGGEIPTAAATFTSGISTVCNEFGPIVDNLVDISTKIDAALKGVTGIGSIVLEFGKMFAPRTDGRGHWKNSIFKDAFSDFDTNMEQLQSLTGVLANFKSAISGADSTVVVDSLQMLMDMQGQMAEFAKFAQKDEFEQFKYAIVSLGAALSLATTQSFDNLSTDGNAVETAISVLKQILDSDELKELAGSIDADTIPDGAEMFKASERLSMFASALAVVGDASTGIKADTAEHINELVKAISEITINELSEVEDISIRFGSLGTALASFAENTSGLTDDNVRTAGQALGMLTTIAGQIKDVGEQSALGKWLFGDKSMTRFGLGLSSLGYNLNRFFENIEHHDLSGNTIKRNEENTRVVVNAAIGLAQAAGHIMNGNADNFVTFSDNLEKAGQGIAAFISSVVGLTKDGTLSSENMNYVRDSVKVFDGIASALNKLNDVNINKMFETLNKGFFGEDVDTGKWDINTGLEIYEHKDGLIDRFKALFVSLKDLSSETSGVDTGFVTNMFASISTMAAHLADLFMSVNKYEDTTAKNAFENFITSLTVLTDSKDRLSEFFNLAASFNQNGINASVGLFTGLNQIGQALMNFSYTDKMMTGLISLKSFDWFGLGTALSNFTSQFMTAENVASMQEAGAFLAGGLASGISGASDVISEAVQSVLDAINAAFTEETISPVITPVVVMDNVNAAAMQIQSMFGGNGISFSGSVPYTMPAIPLPAQETEEPNYTGDFNSLNGSVQSVEGAVHELASAMSNMKIVLNNNVLAGAVNGVNGPAMRYGNRWNSGSTIFG